MKWFDSVRTRLRLLFGRRAAESRMNDEFQLHLEMEIDELVRTKGLAPDEARRQALAAFGGIESHKEALRDGRGLSWISWLDWKLGARMLRKQPALAIVAGLSLAAAITIGVVGIEVTNELFHGRLPFERGDRVVRLETLDVATSRVEPRILHDFAVWRQSLKTVVELGAARVSARNVLTGDGRIEPVPVAEVTASTFPMARVPPLLGRTLQPSDEVQGADDVIVIGSEMWERDFQRDPAIVGRVVSVGRTDRRIVGVMPPGFGFPHNQEMWVPLPARDVLPREGPPVQVFGRLADDAGWEDAEAELASVSARLATDQPGTHAQLRTRVRAFTGRTPGDPLTLQDLAIHAIMLLVLAAVSANVATLIFARTALRESELVVRHALGASRGRVIAQIVTESLVLGLGAAVVGIFAAQFAMRYAWARASQIIGDGLPFWVDLTLEPASVAYALLLAVVAAVMISLLPALKATRASIRQGLQGITSAGGTMKFGGVWSFIIGAQVAVTLLCLPAAAGIASNLLRSESVLAELPTDRFLTFQLSMDDEASAGEQGVPDEEQIAARRALAYEQLATRLREEPGVTDVVLGERLPTAQPEWVAIEIEQDDVPPVRLDGNYEGGFAMTAVGAGYHDAFDAAIVTGRGLRATDAGAPDRPVVVNEAFMRLVGSNPVGARIRTVQRGAEAGVGPWHEIVGVVTGPTIDTTGGAEYIYRAAAAAELDPVVVAVRVQGGAAPLAPRLTTLGRQVDAGLLLREIVTLDEIVARERVPMVVGIVIYGGVLLVALVFSAAGLHALMTVAVQRRTREIGIRVALGANPALVLRAVFARAGRQLGGGIIAGNAIVLFVGWRAEALTSDLVVALMIMSLVMVGVGVLACTVPARRALRVQPTEALREG